MQICCRYWVWQMRVQQQHHPILGIGTSRNSRASISAPGLCYNKETLRIRLQINGEPVPLIDSIFVGKRVATDNT